MKVIVFDLDDTLYDEYTYVKSGFLQVAAFLSMENHLNADEVFDWMWGRLQSHGRGAIFDDVLKEFDCYSKKRVKQCLSVYRNHLPQITLPQKTIECLNRLQHYPMYIVTDGNKNVQHQKLVALGLYEKMKHCYVSHRYGVKNAKPSPYCFLHIAQREKVEPKDIVYIGDNSRKDFVGIKPLAFKTIRVLTGQHKDIRMLHEYEAENEIYSLDELDEDLLQKIFS